MNHDDIVAMGVDSADSSLETQMHILNTIATAASHLNTSMCCAGAAPDADLQAKGHLDTIKRENGIGAGR